MPQTKANLLARITPARARLEQAVAHLSEAQLAQPDAETGWAIKDHLAHLAAWEGGMAALLRGQPRWPAMGLANISLAEQDTDALNEAIYAQSRHLSPAEVLVRFHDSHRQLLAALAGLTDEDLHRSYSTYAPDETDEDRERSVVWWLVANTYEHYQEHLPLIEAARTV
ncbi:MAG: ClbS/DfsB family four-helix bundle protein [Anaerolineae bacterium]|nr:ClbS/DfsB family four-helix bundle protein [Anaerolineae bacterium]